MVAGGKYMPNVKYEVAPDGAIVFVAEIPEFGLAQVRSSRKGIFSCRVTDKRAREAALEAVELFADANASALEPLYDEFAKVWSPARVA
jgi:hypothetical protein